MCEDNLPRFRALKDELEQLSWLNRAMFDRLFNGHAATSDWISHAFDRTDPIEDQCLAERDSDLRIDGDFFLIKRVEPFVYVIVGDATGHHAYAGGLKVFIAAALQRIFDSLTKASSPPEPGTIVDQLQRVFSEVGRSGDDEAEERERGGASIAVIRIETTGGHSISYASAGLPIYALAQTGAATKLGDFSDRKGVRFPSRNDIPPSIMTREAPQEHECAFIAIFSDGFPELVCRRLDTDPPTNESFRETRVLEALTAAVAGGNGGQGPSAQTLVDAVIAAARGFRGGCLVPELQDDDRLIVVIDLTRLCSPPRS